MKQILFVDDEPNFFNGIRRMLRSVRSYKESFGIEKSTAIVEELRGTHFSDELTNAFFESVDGFEEIRARYMNNALVDA